MGLGVVGDFVENFGKRKFVLKVPSLARSVPKPLKVLSLARFVPKPLKLPSLARSVPKFLKVPSLARSVPKPLKVGQEGEGEGASTKAVCTRAFSAASTPFQLVVDAWGSP